MSRTLVGGMAAPTVGIHDPKSTGEFLAWFVSDADCLDYLEWLRWPDGFVCPACAQLGGWRLGDGRFWCSGWGVRTSVTAGTIFDRTRTPLTVWFMACWLFASQKDGVSAQSLQRSLEIGSYQTAWAMLHRLRSVLVRPGRERLTGRVEVDETYIGGEEPGLRGGRARGKKTLVGIAVEVKEPKGFGRSRMAILADGSAASLHPFIHEEREKGRIRIEDIAGYTENSWAVRSFELRRRVRFGAGLLAVGVLTDSGSSHAIGHVIGPPSQSSRRQRGTLSCLPSLMTGNPSAPAVASYTRAMSYAVVRPMRTMRAASSTVRKSGGVAGGAKSFCDVLTTALLPRPMCVAPNGAQRRQQPREVVGRTHPTTHSTEVVSHLQR